MDKARVQMVRVFTPKKDTRKRVLMYANLEFFGLIEVKNWRLFKGDDGGYIVGYPNAPVNLAKGETPYRQVVPKDVDLQDEIKHVMITAYEGLVQRKAEKR